MQTLMSKLDCLKAQSFMEDIRNLLGKTMLKLLLMSVMLSIAACSVAPYSPQGFYNKPETVKARNEIFAIDSTIRQLDYEYAKASNAISVNDAEKVYLQRFEKELLKKREAICQKELNKQRRN